MQCFKTLVMLVTMMVGSAIFALSPEAVVYDVHNGASCLSSTLQFNLHSDDDFCRWLNGIKEGWDEDCNTIVRKTDFSVRSMSGALKIDDLGIKNSKVICYLPLEFSGVFLLCREAILSNIIALE